MQQVFTVAFSDKKDEAPSLYNKRVNGVHGCTTRADDPITKGVRRGNSYCFQNPIHHWNIPMKSTLYASLVGKCDLFLFVYKGIAEAGFGEHCIDFTSLPVSNEYYEASAENKRQVEEAASNSDKYLAELLCCPFIPPSSLNSILFELESQAFALIAQDDPSLNWQLTKLNTYIYYFSTAREKRHLKHISNPTNKPMSRKMPEIKQSSAGKYEMTFSYPIKVKDRTEQDRRGPQYEYEKVTIPVDQNQDGYFSCPVETLTIDLEKVCVSRSQLSRVNRKISKSRANSKEKGKQDPFDKLVNVVQNELAARSPMKKDQNKTQKRGRGKSPLNVEILPPQKPNKAPKSKKAPTDSFEGAEIHVVATADADEQDMDNLRNQFAV